MLSLNFQETSNADLNFQETSRANSKLSRGCDLRNMQQGTVRNRHACKINWASLQ